MMALDGHTTLCPDQTWFLAWVCLGVGVMLLSGLFCCHCSPASPRHQHSPRTSDTRMGNTPPDLVYPLVDSTAISTGLAHPRANSTSRSQSRIPRHEDIIKRLVHVETHDVKRRPSETVTSILNGRYSSDRSGIKMLEGEYLGSITRLRLDDQAPDVERNNRGDNDDALHGSHHSKSSASTISPGDEGQDTKGKDIKTVKSVEKADSGAFGLQPTRGEAGEQQPHGSVSEWAAGQFSEFPFTGSFDLGGLQENAEASTVTMRSEDEDGGGDTVAMTSESELVRVNDELDPILSVNGSSVERIIANNKVIDVKDRSTSIFSLSDTEDLGTSGRCQD